MAIRLRLCMSSTTPHPPPSARDELEDTARVHSCLSINQRAEKKVHINAVPAIIVSAEPACVYFTHCSAHLFTKDVQLASSGIEGGP